MVSGEGSMHGRCIVMATGGSWLTPIMLIAHVYPASTVGNANLINNMNKVCTGVHVDAMT